MQGGAKFYRGGGKQAAIYLSQDAGISYYSTGGIEIRHITYFGGKEIDRRILDSDTLQQWVEGIDTKTGLSKGIIKKGGNERSPLRFVEISINNPKSLSLLESQDDDFALVMESLRGKQEKAVLSYLSEVLLTRIGTRGNQEYVGNLTIEAVSVSHYISRDKDPHSHRHLLINSRVLTNNKYPGDNKTHDNKYHGLDSLSFRGHLKAVNALGSRVLACDQELNKALNDRGLHLNSKGEIKELIDIVKAFSKRGSQCTSNYEVLKNTWLKEHPGKQPSTKQENAWRNIAWRVERPKKDKVLEKREDFKTRIKLELDALGIDLNLVITNSLINNQTNNQENNQRTNLANNKDNLVIQNLVTPVKSLNQKEVADKVILHLGAKQSTWSEVDIRNMTEDLISKSHLIGDHDEITSLIKEITSLALTKCLSVQKNQGIDKISTNPLLKHLSSTKVIEADHKLQIALIELSVDRPSNNGPSSDNNSINKDHIGESSLDNDIFTPLNYTNNATSSDLNIPDLATPDLNILDPAISNLASFDLNKALDLDITQILSVIAISSNNKLEVIIGPAGAGKTRSLEVAKDYLETEGRSLVILSPSRKGALVASEAVGIKGTSVHKLLYEYGFLFDNLDRWKRLKIGDIHPITNTIYQGPSKEHLIDDKSVVVVDEASMLDVGATNALLEVIKESKASIRLIGDPFQLGSIGRGGVLLDASSYVDPIELNQIHRFEKVIINELGIREVVQDKEYGSLSLDLRLAKEKDTLEVADQLINRGAIKIHLDRDQALLEIANEVTNHGVNNDTSRNHNIKDTVISVSTNEDARDLSALIRDQRVSLGLVDDELITYGRKEVRIGRGDLIVTRENNKDLQTTNRSTLLVLDINKDGSLIALDVNKTPKTLYLPSDYVRSSCELGYATTDYGTQGVTSTYSHTLINNFTSSNGLYVGATRGRRENTIHVIADDLDQAKDQLIKTMLRDRGDLGLSHAIKEANKQPFPQSLLEIPPITERLSEPEISLITKEFHDSITKLDIRLNDLIANQLSQSERKIRDQKDQLTIKSSNDLIKAYEAQLNNIAQQENNIITQIRSDFTNHLEDLLEVNKPGIRLRAKREAKELALKRIHEREIKYNNWRLPTLLTSKDYAPNLGEDQARYYLNQQTFPIKVSINQENSNIRTAHDSLTKRVQLDHQINQVTNKLKDLKYQLIAFNKNLSWRMNQGAERLSEFDRERGEWLKERGLELNGREIQQEIKMGINRNTDRSIESGIEMDYGMGF